MKTSVALIFGGRSVEHEVAVISALQAYGSLDKSKYEVVPVYLAKDGKIYTGDELLKIENFKDIPSLLSKCFEAVLTPVADGVQVLGIARKRDKIKVKSAKTVTVGFPIVHGTFCEDGTVAGWMELLNIPYVGCDVVSAADGMDKLFFKNICNANDIPVLKCEYFTSREWVNCRDEVMKKVEKIGYPFIVKPVNLGSSVGISMISNPDELDEKISNAAQFCDKLLIEPAVTALREINCSVVGSADDCEASVLEEPVKHDEILSYTDKYMSGGKGSKDGSKSSGMASLSRKIPAELSEQKTAEICELAKKTFKALGCNGVARIDFILDSAAEDKVYVNEINTIPGSLSFYLWEPKGVKYAELLDRLIKLAFERERKRKGFSFSFDTNLLSSGSFGAKGTKK